MKNIIYVIFIFIVISSCKSSSEFYSHEGDRIAFPKILHYDLFSKTFMYDPVEVVQDTIWLRVETLGFIRDYDRKISLEQEIVEDENNAISGKHYLDFKDAKLADKYIIKAGESKITLPIIVLRDISLKESEVILSVRLVENEDFNIVKGEDTEEIKNWSTRKLFIADVLIKPGRWTWAMDRDFGIYSKVKHQFLIDFSGFKWDDEFILSLNPTYKVFMKAEAKTALYELNEERKADGKGPLMSENNELVVIP